MIEIYVAIVSLMSLVSACFVLWMLQESFAFAPWYLRVALAGVCGGYIYHAIMPWGDVVHVPWHYALERSFHPVLWYWVWDFHQGRITEWSLRK
ncbi:MAG: hypothetical protein AAF542_17940 [Pseudomonadota bacterium]